MKNAFMIRNDGKVFQVDVHLYGNDNVEDVEETLYAGEWLYYHTRYEDVKQHVIDLFSLWAEAEFDDYTQEDILEYAKDLGYTVFSEKFIKEVFDKLKKPVGSASLEDMNSLVCKELNQEFLRARYGGMLNTESKSHEMVFRVSSVDFDWFNYIYAFVSKLMTRLNIEYVTIVRDQESTGEEYFYKTGNHIFDNMPVKEFLTLPGNPVVESLSLMEHLDVHSVKEINRMWNILEKLDIEHSYIRG